MIPDQVIVTLMLEEEPLGDYELPTGILVKELSVQLLDILKKQAPRIFQTWNVLYLSSGNLRLEEEDTLAARGIWDGSYLAVSQD